MKDGVRCDPNVMYEFTSKFDAAYQTPLTRALMCKDNDALLPQVDGTVEQMLQASLKTVGQAARQK